MGDNVFGVAGFTRGMATAAPDAHGERAPNKCLIRLTSFRKCCNRDSQLGKTIVSDVNLLGVSLRIL